MGTPQDPPYPMPPPTFPLPDPDAPPDPDEDEPPPAPLPSVASGDPRTDPEPKLQPPVACEERERLMEIYLASVAVLDKVAKALAKALGTPDLLESQTGTQDARLVCEAAIVALNDHRREHGC